MKAARIHQFGGPEVILIDELPEPTPGPGEVLVRVAGAGVGPWDALIRERKSVVEVSLPLILGSDLSGTVEAAGDDVALFKPGDQVYGVTNPNFIGAYAQFALARADMMAHKPASLNWLEACSVPVVAVTAWQALFDYGEAKPGQAILILGAGGNVGAYAVQLAAQAGLHVFGTASASDLDYVRSLGAELVFDYRAEQSEGKVPSVDIVLDTVGGQIPQRVLGMIKPGGILVSVVSPPPEDLSSKIRSVFFLVEVTTERLDRITDLLQRRKLLPRMGSVLPLERARHAHEMLGGVAHKPGKIVLDISGHA